MSDKCFCHLNGYKVKDPDGRKAENISLVTEDTYIPVPDNVRDAIIALANRFASVDSAIASKANMEHEHNSLGVILNPPVVFMGETFTTVGALVYKLASLNIVSGVETPTLEKINGKTVYAKFINLGPIGGTAMICEHQISNLDTIVSVSGTARSSDGTVIDIRDLGELSISEGYVRVEANYDVTEYTCNVTLKYTKE